MEADVGDCPASCRMFSSIPGLYLPEASGTPVMTTKNVSRHCPVSPEGQNQPSLRTTGLTETNLMKGVFTEAWLLMGYSKEWRGIQGLDRVGSHYDPKSRRGERRNSVTAPGHRCFCGNEARTGREAMEKCSPCQD